MIKPNDTVFGLVKAIIEASQSERALEQAIRALESQRLRSELIEKLRSVLSPGYQAASPPKETHRGSSKKRSQGDPDLERIFVFLKTSGVSARQVHDVILREFRQDVPVNKEGLAKYLRRVSKRPFFPELAMYLMSGGKGSSVNSNQDPWVKQMLSRQTRKSREPDDQ